MRNVVVRQRGRRRPGGFHNTGSSGIFAQCIGGLVVHIDSVALNAAGFNPFWPAVSGGDFSLHFF